MSVAITIDQVIKRFGNNTIIDGLSLDVAPGEFFTLLGPSGCGKTTLLRMIIGFNSIEGGTIKIDNKLINDIPTNLRNMGMVFQNYAIFPHLSVAENVAFGLKTRKTPAAEVTALVDEILEIVKIGHLKNRMPTQLSGGQQQRVALARAIVIHPQVLLMDEPLSNLDAKLRVEMRNAIKKIQQKIGITTIYVTHDQEEALAVSDRIAVMNDGIIQQIGSPQQIYQRPNNLFVSTFIGLSNVLQGTLTVQDGCKSLNLYGAVFPLTNLVPTVTDGQAVCVAIRPEEFIINPVTSPGGISAVIKNSVFLGVTTHYFLELASSGQEIEVIQPSEIGSIIPPETPVQLSLQLAKINVFLADGSASLIAGSDNSC
ncbi:MAG: ABC transporter ATP-binding protein [Acidaminococcaceae bacterium]